MPQYNLGFILYLTTIFISLLMILWETSKVEPTKTSVILWIFQFLSIFWLVAGLIENLSTTNAELFYSIRFTLLPLSFITGVFLIFSLYYSNIPENGGFLTKSRITKLILIITAILYFPTLTKSHFYLIVEYKDISNTGYTEWGPFFMTQYYLSLTYIIIGLFLIIYKRIKEKRTHPNRTYIDIILLFIGIMIPFTTNLMGWFVDFFPQYDVTPIFFTLSNILVAQAVVNYNLLNTSVSNYDACYMENQNITLILNSDYTLRNTSLPGKDWLKQNDLSSHTFNIDHLAQSYDIPLEIIGNIMIKKYASYSSKDGNVLLENITIENTLKGMAITIKEENTFNADAYFSPREFLDSFGLSYDFLPYVNGILNDESLEKIALQNNFSYIKARKDMGRLFQAVVGPDFNEKKSYKIFKEKYKDFKKFE